MSVCNFVMSADRIIVATDTIAFDGHAPAMATRKIDVNPSARVAVATRGTVRQSRRIRAIIQCSDSFSDTAEAIRRHLSDGIDGGNLEATLLGWQGGPRVIRFTADPDYTHTTGKPYAEHTFGVGVYLSPALAGKLPAEVSPEQLVKLTVLQREWPKSKGELPQYGGDIELTWITADGIATQTVAEYPDRAEMMAAVDAWMAAREWDAESLAAYCAQADADAVAAYREAMTWAA